jgi:hypothetical protein
MASGIVDLIISSGHRFDSSGKTWSFFDLRGNGDVIEKAIYYEASQYYGAVQVK